MKDLEDKIKEKGVLSRKKLKELIAESSKGEAVKITDNQIDIFLQVLDVNGKVFFFEKEVFNCI